MRTLFVVIGFVLVLVLLVSNGIIGGGLCIEGVGCLYSTGDGLKMDSSTQATIGVK